MSMAIVINGAIYRIIAYQNVKLRGVKKDALKDFNCSFGTTQPIKITARSPPSVIITFADRNSIIFISDFFPKVKYSLKGVQMEHIISIPNAKTAPHILQVDLHLLQE